MQQPTPGSFQALLARRQEFARFVANRLPMGGEAEDVLQSSFVKALRQAEDLREETKLVPWFYQLLRNAIIDHARSRQASRTRDAVWQSETAAPDEETQRALCGCLEGLLPLLKPREAALVRRVDLERQPVAQAAVELGITPGNASVLLHRGRKALRTQLEAFCGDCTARACLDCHCDTAEGDSPTTSDGACAASM